MPNKLRIALAAILVAAAAVSAVDSASAQDDRESSVLLTLLTTRTGWATKARTQSSDGEVLK
jgi:hypothetical protein